MPGIEMDDNEKVEVAPSCRDDQARPLIWFAAAEVSTLVRNWQHNRRHITGAKHKRDASIHRGID